MARRSVPYLIELPGDSDFKVSGAEWREALDRGVVTPAPDRYKVARPASGVIARVWDGDLYFFARIRVSSASWYRAWLYSVGAVSASAVGEGYFERQERALRELDRELQNEALLWRTFRDGRTRGANSFAWIPHEHKIEIIRALEGKLN